MNLHFLSPDSDEWTRAWDKAVPGPDKEQLDADSGEVWQYMGTALQDGRWQHDFRHRMLPPTRQRVYRRVDATPSWWPEDAPKPKPAPPCPYCYHAGQHGDCCPLLDPALGHSDADPGL